LLPGTRSSRLGGVENHIYSLSTHLIRQGHKVVVITHAYGESRKGVRYLPGPLKVYYCPFVVMTDQDAMPTFTATLPLVRQILIRERIEILHAHQATSTLANEGLAYGAAMGLATVYTDHSLFGFGDVASIVLNRVLQVTLATADALIAVSHTCRDNLVLRASVRNACSVTSIGGIGNTALEVGNNVDRRKRTPKQRVVAVIPNAVDPSQFSPPAASTTPSGARLDRIVVVVLSRLVYRKGVDLLTSIVPIVCRSVDFVDFVIGGDGNKMLQVREMVERFRLHERVTLLGAVPHDQVRDVLVRGHVFLNCSLTESFCIALLEAACCGLLSVSTNVGGVPEVLPDDLIYLSDPNVPAMVDSVIKAIFRQRNDPLDPADTHRRVASMYSWGRVAKETADVYDRIVTERRQRLSDRPDWYRGDLCERLDCYVSALGGRIGPTTLAVCALAVALELWLRLVEWWQPRHEIDVVPDLITSVDESNNDHEAGANRDGPSTTLRAMD
jgi:phosphatidylinositol N-acetylglucosaminyltransferase subunit A